MDTEDEMVNLCLISQANQIESLLQQISALNNQIQDIQQNAIPTDVEKSQPLDNDNDSQYVLQQEKRIESLYSENEALQKELEEWKEKYGNLEKELQEEKEANSNIQSQSVEQIQKQSQVIQQIKEENEKLNSELNQMKQRETTSQMQSQNQQKEMKQLQFKYDQLEERYQSLEQQLEEKKQESLQDLKPTETPVRSKPVINDISEIDSLSFAELKDLYISEHNRVDLLNTYFKQLDEIMDETLAKYVSSDFKMDEDIATHDKMKYFIHVMTVEKEGNSGNIELLRECEEWKSQVIGLKQKLTDITSDRDFLQACVDCCDHYLDCLVGNDKKNTSNILSSLENRCKTVCRRSEKLIKQYESILKQYHLLNEELNTLKQAQLPTEMNYHNITHFMKTVQLLAEHMNVIPKNCNPSLSVLENAVRRIDEVLKEQLPLFAKRLTDLQHQLESEILKRNQLESRLHLYERNSFVSFSKQTITRKITLTLQNDFLYFRITFTHRFIR